MASDFPIFAELADGCGTGCDYVALAEYALETGDWQAAELYAFKAVYKAQTKEQVGLMICAYHALIRLYLYQGKADDALELLRQLRQDVTRANNLYYNTGLEIVEGYVYGCLTRLDSIPLWLQTGDMSPAHFFYEGMGFNYIVYGKALCSQRITSSSKRSPRNLSTISPSSTTSSGFCTIRFSGRRRNILFTAWRRDAPPSAKPSAWRGRTASSCPSPSTRPPS
jgi:hypothetical protein